MEQWQNANSPENTEMLGGTNCTTATLPTSNPKTTKHLCSEVASDCQADVQFQYLGRTDPSKPSGYYMYHQV